MDVWEKKYNSLLKSYNDLLEVRVKSVVQDIELFKCLLEEHKKSQSLSKKSFEENSEKLKNIKNDIIKKRQEKKDLIKKIENLKSNLMSYNQPIINILIKYPEFKTIMIDRGVFQVDVPSKYQISFIVSEKNSKVHFSPNLDSRLMLGKEYYKRHSIEFMQLDQMCKTLSEKASDR